MIRSIVGFGAPIIESDPIIGSIVEPIIELIVLSAYSHASFTVHEILDIMRSNRDNTDCYTYSRAFRACPLRSDQYFMIDTVSLFQLLNDAPFLITLLKPSKPKHQ